MASCFVCAERDECEWFDGDYEPSFVDECEEFEWDEREHNSVPL